MPAHNIADSRYQDLMDDPIACIERTYTHFGMTLTDIARARMLDYLAEKPRGKFGAHTYEVDEARSGERVLFARYQAAYNVPNEC